MTSLILLSGDEMRTRGFALAADRAGDELLGGWFSRAKKKARRLAKKSPIGRIAAYTPAGMAMRNAGRLRGVAGMAKYTPVGFALRKAPGVAPYTPVGLSMGARTSAARRFRAMHGDEAADELLGGFFKRMVRKTKNVAKKTTHVALQSARAAKQISSGDIGGALSRIGSTVSNVTGSNAGASLEAAGANALSSVKSSGWKGYALAGGGLVSVIAVLMLVLKRRG